MAAYLVAVPLDRSLEMGGVPEPGRLLLEPIVQRAARLHVPVDVRVEAGRTLRHAIHQLIERESFDRIVIPAATETADGFSPDDIGWLLDHAPGELVVLRPGVRQASSRNR